MNALIAQIRNTARRLLAEGRVELVLGFEQGPIALRNAPCFVRNAEDADRLTWDRACGLNLAVFLNGSNPRKIAIFAKACDTRTIVNQIKERRFARENIVIVGVPCEGMIDRRKVERRIGDSEMDEAKIEGEVLIVRALGKTFEMRVEDVLRDACRACVAPTPMHCDLLLEGVARVGNLRLFADGQAGKSCRLPTCATPSDRAERRERFRNEAAKCIRCYACRNVCPMCYCRECCADQAGPRWIGASPTPSNNQMYLLMRALHLAGRCVDCGACVEACPVGVDVRHLFKRMEREVQERFGHESGKSPDEKPPLAGYDMSDRDDFVTDV